ncbi:MAG: dethiobiotin synthase [Gammaproteobacteria bacterium]|nr:MAG: dethiobiotin synthase [Gammaproteobacteria bacterium]
MSRFFISASGTEIGKTFVTSTLITQLRAAGHSVDALKPVATGYDPREPERSDSGVLLAALGRPIDTRLIEQITPWRFEEPLSPDMAADREEQSIPFTQLVDFCAERPRVDVTLIEGIGGIMVPLDSSHTVLDWLEALAIPVLLIVGGYLGTLSHTLTAVGMLRSRGQELAGIIVNESADQPVTLVETANVIARFVEPAPVLLLPRLQGTDQAPDLLPLLAPYL